MSFEIIFEERAISRAADFLADDPTGVRALLDAIDAGAGLVYRGTAYRITRAPQANAPAVEERLPTRRLR